MGGRCWGGEVCPSERGREGGKEYGGGGGGGGGGDGDGLSLGLVGGVEFNCRLGGGEGGRSGCDSLGDREYRRQIKGQVSYQLSKILVVMERACRVQNELN